MPINSPDPGERVTMSEVEGLLRLAELASSRHDQRRQYEWKVSLGLWALLAIGSLRSEALPRIHASIGAGVVFLYALLWLRGVWVANANDKSLAQFYWTAAEGRLRGDTKGLGERPARLSPSSWDFWIGFLKNWAMQFHFVVTMVLVAFFFYVHGGETVPQHQTPPYAVPRAEMGATGSPRVENAHEESLQARPKGKSDPGEESPHSESGQSTSK